MYRYIEDITPDDVDTINRFFGRDRYDKVVEVLGMSNDELKGSLNITLINVPRKFLILKYLQPFYSEYYDEYLKVLDTNFIIDFINNNIENNSYMDESDEIDELAVRSAISKTIYCIKTDSYKITLLEEILNRLDDIISTNSIQEVGQYNSMIEEILSSINDRDTFVAVVGSLGYHTNDVLTKYVFNNSYNYNVSTRDVLRNIIASMYTISIPMVIRVLKNIKHYTSSQEITDIIVERGSTRILGVSINLWSNEVDYDSLLSYSKLNHREDMTNFILDVLSQV